MKRLILSIVLCLSFIIANGGAHVKYIDHGLAERSKDVHYVAYYLYNHNDSDYKIVKAELTCVFTNGSDTKSLTKVETVNLDPSDSSFLMFNFQVGFGYSFVRKTAVKVYYADGSSELI